jgi:beta-phosphoglucomutase
MEGPDMPGVLFDLDGTLVNSYAAHFEAWTLLSAELGHTLSEPQFAKQFGRKNEPIIAELHEFIGKPLPNEQAVQTMAEHKESMFRACIGRGDFPFMPGALDLLEALRSSGWALAVGSSAPRVNIDFAMQQFAAKGMTFDAVVCGCDVSNGKPAPEVFLLAASRLGVPPDACVVFEDAAPGIEAGRRAGMPTIGIASQGRTHEELAAATMVIDAFAQVDPALLASLL